MTNPIAKLSKMMLFLLLFFSLCIYPAIPQVSAEVPTKAQIENYIEAYLNEYRVPGASVAIIHNNELFFSKSWGVTGETREKVTSETPFTIGSISKSLTGIGVMKLIDNGIVGLDDQVQDHLPWFTLKDKQAASQITIRHLLAQTSGLSTFDGLVLSDKEATGSGAIRNQVRLLHNAALTAKPGEKHQYSNANYLILGALIEEVSNQPYAEYMEQHIFGPLGMPHAAADKETAYKRGYLSGYQSWFGFPVKSSVDYDNAGAPYGYITASTTDLLQFIKLLNGKGLNHLISEKNLDLYMTPQVQTSEDRYYGLGIRVSNPDSSERLIWHSGSTPDSHAELFYLPESGWGGVILTNKNNTLEEEGLYYLKHGIINLLNGDETVEIPHLGVTIQFIVLGAIFLLMVLSIYLFNRLKSKKPLSKGMGLILGILFIILSIGIVPLLISSVGSPWHSIKVFAPDIAFLMILTVISMALNGLLAMTLAFKKAR